MNSVKCSGCRVHGRLCSDHRILRIRRFQSGTPSDYGHFPRLSQRLQSAARFTAVISVAMMVQWLQSVPVAMAVTMGMNGGK